MWKQGRLASSPPLGKIIGVGSAVQVTHRSEKAVCLYLILSNVGMGPVVRSNPQRAKTAVLTPRAGHGRQFREHLR